MTPEDWARDDLGGGCFAIDLDGQVQSFHVSIRDALITRGVLRLVDGVWHLHWHGWNLEQERAAWMGCCDFCAARPVVWRFPCADFDLPEDGSGTPLRSYGEWDACTTCGGHIRAHDWPALLAHVNALKRAEDARLPRAVRSIVLAFRAELQYRFRTHYRGEAIPVQPHPFGQ